MKSASYDDWYRLFDDLCDGLLSESDGARLNELLLSDESVRREYLAYMQVHAGLAVTNVDVAASTTRAPDCSKGDADDTTSPLLPPIVVAPEPLAVRRRFSNGHATVFSYSVATILVLIGLLLGWVRQVSQTGDVAQVKPAASKHATSRLPASEPDVTYVARVSGTADCQWADATDEISEGSYLPLGRSVTLTAGLVEVTYDSGAVVLLQGPCRYQVQSPRSGFLSVGALTARVESARGSPVSKDEPAFMVCTPTAVVSDLGTEFGVQVDGSGASRADVFRGKIRVCLAAERSTNGHSVELGENQSAQVERGGKDRVQLTRIVPAPDMYVRRIPKRTPLKLANTGAELKEGAADPRWQISSRSDAPSFAPRPATVATVRVLRAADDPGREYVTHLPNDPKQSQWISLTNDGEVSNNVTYTFRTTLDLKDFSPKSAVVRMRYLVDDRLTKVRLNGQPIELPPVPSKSFMEWRELKISEGFVEGPNVLEIDVYNEDAVATRAASPMMFRAELEGSAVPRWHRTERNPGTDKRSSQGV